jgi:hypothetical protein
MPSKNSASFICRAHELPEVFSHGFLGGDDRGNQLSAVLRKRRALLYACCAGIASTEPL